MATKYTKARNARKTLISFVCFVFSCLSWMAKAAPSRDQPQAIFRSATDIVEVDVVAQDRNGQFVRDLRPEDFEIREDGSPQNVEQMYFVDGGNVASTVLTPPSEATSATPLGPSPASARQRVFVALFDTDHLTNAGFKRVQAAAIDLFSKEFKAGDVGGIVMDRHVYKDRLTTDREELLAGVRSARPGHRAASRKFDETMWPRLSTVEAVRIVFYKEAEVKAAAVQRACADDPVQCNNADLAISGKAAQLAGEVQADTAMTMQTMAVLLRGLQRLDGRKTILLLTEGFLADQSWPLVKDAIGEAARVDARIYTLDARGLDRTNMAEYLRGAFPTDSSPALNMLRQFDFSDDAMNSLAVDTGGFVVRNQNYFDKAVAQIVSDASTYYVLGYRPAKAPDGKYRSIAVKAKRPGVLVRARRGYVATAKAAPVMTAAAPAAAATASEPETAAPPAAAAALASAPATSAAVPSVESPAPAAPGSPAVVTSAPPGSQGFRFRPDAGKHVDLLLKDEAGDAAAKAGWDAYQRGDVATARASLGVAAASPSARPWVHYALGLSEYALRQFKDSATEWEIVRRAAPSFQPVYFDLVDSYLQLHQQDEAIRVLRAGRERWPSDPDIYNALGVVQTSRGAVDDAVKSFQEAVTLTPNDHVSRYNLARALEMRYNRSRRYIRQQQRWISNEQDRNDAIDNYRAAVAIGGAFNASAEQGLQRLNWTPKP